MNTQSDIQLVNRSCMLRQEILVKNRFASQTFHDPHGIGMPVSMQIDGFVAMRIQVDPFLCRVGGPPELKPRSCR